VGWVEKNKQRQERGVKGLRPTLPQLHAKDGAPDLWWRFTHLSDDEAVAKMGHPAFVAGKEGYLWLPKKWWPRMAVERRPGPLRFADGP
jgi:hypothetical protein